MESKRLLCLELELGCVGVGAAEVLSSRPRSGASVCTKLSYQAHVLAQSTSSGPKLRAQLRSEAQIPSSGIKLRYQAHVLAQTTRSGTKLGAQLTFQLTSQHRPLAQVLDQVPGAGPQLSSEGQESLRLRRDLWLTLPF